MESIQHNAAIAITGAIRRTSKEICSANQLNGFYMMGTLVVKELSDTIMTKTLLFGDSSLSDSPNTLILDSTIDYIIATKRFDGPIVT